MPHVTHVEEQLKELWRSVERLQTVLERVDAESARHERRIDELVRVLEDGEFDLPAPGDQA